jgi:hypothetical protein
MIQNPEPGRRSGVFNRQSPEWWRSLIRHYSCVLMNPSWRQGHDSDIYPTWKKSLAHERGKKLGYGMAEILSLAILLVGRACEPADKGLTHLNSF